MSEYFDSGSRQGSTTTLWGENGSALGTSRKWTARIDLYSLLPLFSVALPETGEIQRVRRAQTRLGECPLTRTIRTQSSVMCSK